MQRTADYTTRLGRTKEWFSQNSARVWKAVTWILVGIALVVAYNYWPSSWGLPDSWKLWSSNDEGQDGTSAETAASDSTATDSVATISVEEMIRLEVEKALVEERRQDSIRDASPLKGYEYDPSGRTVYIAVFDTLNDGRVFVSREKGPAWRKKQ